MAVKTAAPTPATAMESDTETETAPPVDTATTEQQTDPDFDRLSGQVRQQYGFQDGADLARSRCSMTTSRPGT